MTNSSIVPNLTAGLSPQELTDAFLAYRRRLESVILRIVGRYGEAEELTQECFLRAYRARHTFQGRSGIGTWLTRIALNVAYESTRRRKQVVLSMDEETIAAKVANVAARQPTPEQRVLAHERAENVAGAVERLTPRLRNLLELHYVKELSIPEISRQTGLGHSAVKSLLFRARHRLRHGRLKPWDKVTKLDPKLTDPDRTAAR